MKNYLNSLIVSAAVFGLAGCGAMLGRESEEEYRSCPDLSADIEAASRLRGLEFKYAPACRLVSPAQLTDFVAHSDLSSKNAEAEAWRERAFRAIELIAKDFPYRQCMTELRSVGVQSHFQPAEEDREGVLYIPDTPEVRHDLIVHELVHALQDQHFGLARLVDGESDSTDSLLARLALVEGDATVVQHRYLLEHPITEGSINTGAGNDQAELRKQCESSAELGRILDFPYDWGALFFRELRKGGGGSAVDGVFADPPSTTEQVMHADQFAVRAAEVREHTQIDLPEALEHYGDLRFSDELGQFVFYQYLRRYLDPRLSGLASIGWDGDRLGIWTRSKGAGAAGLVRWDTYWSSEKDALESFNALCSVAQRQTIMKMSRSSQRCWFRGAELLSVRRKGARVELSVPIAEIKKD